MLNADYFDGRSTRVREVSLEVIGADLMVCGLDFQLRVPFADVKVDERLGRAPRRLRFGDGAFCEVSDLPALDDLLSATAHRDGWVDRTQRRARSVGLAVIACAAVVAAGYLWGLPWAAAEMAPHIPAVVVEKLSVETLGLLDAHFLQPSKIAADRRQALTAEFQALRLPEGGTPKADLLFRRSPQLGANAITLPNGTILVLDDLITVIDDDRQIIAALAHEAGHAHGRHSMRLLLESSVVGMALAFSTGDISSLMAVAPATLVQARYSRDLEEQADDYAAAVLALNGMSPSLLADALDKLSRSRPGTAQPGYLSSHPARDDRMRHLRALPAGGTGAGPLK